MSENEPIIAELEARIAMGSQAGHFIKTDLGRYIVARSEADEAEALALLAEADAEDAKLIRKYQNQIYRSRTIREWLVELIQDGLQAEQTIDAPEE
jgi:hypothetical protein